MTRAALLVFGVGLIVLVVGAGIWFTMVPAEAPTEPLVPTSTPVTNIQLITPVPASPAAVQPTSFTQTKAAHFVSSEPAHNAVVATAPSAVKIHFNFDVASPSEITVTRDDVDVTSGATTIAADKLSMSVPIQAEQPGNYLVRYTACWPDTSCHNGSFGFSVQ